MRERDRAHFRRLLEDRLVAIFRAAHGELRSHMGASGEEPDPPRDEIDEAQRVQLQDTRMNLAESETLQAQQIEEALKRLTHKTYGLCIDCGSTIELSRLRAVPWALRCIEDQEAFEFEGRDRSPSL